MDATYVLVKILTNYAAPGISSMFKTLFLPISGFGIAPRQYNTHQARASDEGSSSDMCILYVISKQYKKCVGLSVAPMVRTYVVKYVVYILNALLARRLASTIFLYHAPAVAKYI